MADFVPSHFDQPRRTIFPIEYVDDLEHGRTSVVPVRAIKAAVCFRSIAWVWLLRKSRTAALIAHEIKARRISLEQSICPGLDSMLPASSSARPRENLQGWRPRRSVVYQRRGRFFRPQPPSLLVNLPPVASTCRESSELMPRKTFWNAARRLTTGGFFLRRDCRHLTMSSRRDRRFGLISPAAPRRPLPIALPQRRRPT
jgi:hypothetical protein